MATVHPSRMRLIPEALRESHNRDSKTRSPSPRRRSRTPERERERDRGRDDRERVRDDRGRDRDSRGRNDPRESEKRRASPQYEDYRRPPPPHMAEDRGHGPGHDNMYPPRHDRPRHGNGGVPFGAAGSDFMESRRQQREALVVDVWPPSPKQPARELSPARKKSSKHKRRRSVSTDSDSSEEERRKKEKKEKKRSKRKEKDERREKRKHRRSRSRGRDSEDEDSEEERRHRHKHRRTRSPERERERERDSHRDKDDERRAHRHRTRSKSKSRSKSRAKTEEPMDVDRHDKDHRHTSVTSASNEKARQPSSAPSHEESDDDDEVGPQPMTRKSDKKFDERAYGGALLRGEGSAMAAFLQDGTESRIPRRGEIGLTSDEIAKYEDVGYVMSGSRHKRMNAVRMRKENQVISAEEKRGILKLQKEERDRREMILREELLDMMNEKLKSQAISAHIDPPVD